jgi:hypothetical protein
MAQRPSKIQFPHFRRCGFMAKPSDGTRRHFFKFSEGPVCDRARAAFDRVVGGSSLVGKSNADAPRRPGNILQDANLGFGLEDCAIRFSDFAFYFF